MAMMKTAVQHQVHAERNKGVANLLHNVEAAIWCALRVPMVVDQNSILHLVKNVVTLKVMKMGSCATEYKCAHNL